MWCVLELENKKQYKVHCKYLEDELGDPLNAEDLQIGKAVIWKSKGTPYQGSIVEISSKLYNVLHVYIIY